ncbi:MAG TPA: TlpA disulfide reductase family protein, partial [Tepidisphaeraceae bacterium]|nr:TlpA disulfide reductase family protein [Tepidisphaeraceae bacterium]
QLLSQNNPSLLLALSLNPAGELTLGISRVDRVADTKIDGVSCPTLSLVGLPGEPTETAVIDPATHLIRELRANLKDALEAQGENNVQLAKLVVSYKTAVVNAELSAKDFEWTPPKKAENLTSDRPELAPMLQVGKAAPNFSLSDVEGNTVSLSQLKGHVVVLDFWATICAPCLASMPRLSELYAKMKPQGVEMFAINTGESPGHVRLFLKKYPNLIALPILLDSDEAVAERFDAAESLPTTVVINRDGIIARVFVGISPRGEQPLRRQIEKLLK